MTTKSKAAPAPRQSVVRSIDVGFGLVKLSLGDGHGGVRFMHFPSMAIPSDPSAMRALGSRRRDTFDVPVATSSYEVGVDVELAQTGNDFGRDVTDEFYRGTIYEALVKGALRYMAESGDTEIDVLVMGLPVNQYLDEVRRSHLINKYTAELEVGAGKTVKVRQVLVQPQPMGGFIELGTHLEGLNQAITRSKGALKPIESPEELHDLSILMVDPGEHTLDWLLIQEGLPHTKASGAASDAGRHRVVRAVLEALQAKVGRPLPPATLPRINDSLRTGKPLRLSGEAHDLTEFEGVIRSAVEDPINRLVEGMRGMHEVIDIIALVGGHPARYRDVLADRFPLIPVFVVDDPVMANVRGFQLIGLAQLEHEGEQVAA